MISVQLLPLSAPHRRVMAFAAVAGLLLLPTVSGCSKDTASQQDPPSASDPVVARVNGVDIRQSDLAFAEEDMAADTQQLAPEAKRDQLITYLADIILVTQVAEKRNRADSTDFRRRLAFLRNKLLMGIELQEEAKAALTEEALREVYNDAVKNAVGQEEVRARHILVETEEEAKAILEQIKAGADFATLAKEKSKDPGAAAGGDLGYFTKDQMVPEFAEVAFKMYPGQVSNPVKTQFGWHIIKVEDKRTKPVPSFEQVRERIEGFVIRKAQTEFITKLRQSAKVERVDQPEANPEAKPLDIRPEAKPAEPPAEPKK
jgi:peptidyl-prolyl cis-trans isomerase C